MEFFLMGKPYPPKGCKFVALYNDGSGADMFMRTDGGDYISCSGEDCTEENLDYFFCWAFVPENYEFWCEFENEREK